MKEEQATTLSRSAVKRRAQQVEETAHRLLECSAAELRSLDWPDDLRQELLLAGRTRAHGARKRQIKHLAALLRRDEISLARAEAVVAAKNGHHQEQVKDFQQLEMLRDGLCDAARASQALQDVRGAFPDCDAEKLSALAQMYRNTGDRKHYREIFRLLRAAAEKPRT